MKILLGVHQFFPDYSSGTEVLTLSVAKGLIANGHAVRIYTGFPSSINNVDENIFDRYVFESITVHRFHHAYTPTGVQSSMIEIGYDNQKSADHFGCILKEFRPDVVHFFHLNRIGSRLIEVAHAANVPCYLTTTDFWAVCPTAQLLLPSGRQCDGPDSLSANCVGHFAANKQRGFVPGLISHLPQSVLQTAVWAANMKYFPDFPFRHEVRAIGKRLDVNVSRLNLLRQILVPTAYMRALLVRYGVSSALISIRPFGVRAPGTKGHVRRFVEGQALRIGFIGTLAPHKGCHVLLNAVQHLSPGLVALSIYGRGDEFQAYVDAMKTSSAATAGVAWKGTFPNDIIDAVLDELDVLVVPSTWRENTPLVVYSALSSRCPLIVSDVGGLTEVVTHGKNGLTFAAGDADDLRRQVLRLISEKNLLNELSSHCQPSKSDEEYLNDLFQTWGAP